MCSIMIVASCWMCLNVVWVHISRLLHVIDHYKQIELCLVAFCVVLLVDLFLGNWQEHCLFIRTNNYRCMDLFLSRTAKTKDAINLIVFIVCTIIWYIVIFCCAIVSSAITLLRERPLHKFLKAHSAK